jgi:hypothetical protein
MSTAQSALSTSERIQRCLALRNETAAHDAFKPAAPQIDNGDEHHYPDKCGTYTKGLQQSGIGLVDPAAYRSFKNALNSGDPADFDKIILGGPRTLNGPQASLAFSLDCLDGAQYHVKPAPRLASEEYAGELVEMYWASLLRDVAFTDYAMNPIAQLAAAELSGLPATTYTGPRNAANMVTPDLLFRGAFIGEQLGPWLSQFIVNDTSFGAMPIKQQYTSNAPNMDFMLTPAFFQQVQNGIATTESLTSVTTPLYLHDGRGLSAFTHVDVLYQAYFMAFLVLNTINGGKVPSNPGNPYVGDKTQNGFATFGPPDAASALAAVAADALKAVWYQKWLVHLRHRPESGGALVYLTNNPSAGSVLGKLSSTVLNSKAVQTAFTTNNSYFLSQAFPEGSPTHPAYPTGHGTVAGACITILKFFYDGNTVIQDPKVPLSSGVDLADYTGPDAGMLTVNGELNKLASNISFGHGILAGIHWRSDTESSIRLGEAVALSYLQDRANTYNEKFTVQLTKLDGTTATISNQ